MKSQARFVGLDVHRQSVTVAMVDEGQQVLTNAQRVTVDNLATWARTHLRASDWVALEATTNTWTIYDSLKPLVAEVIVADAYKVGLISHSSRKTGPHDALMLAKLLAAKLLPSVWVVGVN